MKKAIRKLVFYAGQVFRLMYYSFLRFNGVEIGKNTFISLGAKIDTQFGEVCIGDNVHITSGCVLLAHDGALKQMDPSANPRGKITIEDNVFIGVNSVLLMNVVIGKNSVIGAGSVVNKDVPANSLAIGNPAKVIRRLE